MHLHTKITARVKQIDDERQAKSGSASRPRRAACCSATLLPLNAKAPFDLVNRLLSKKEIADVIDTVYRHCGQKEIGDLLRPDHGLGFREAFKAGISFGKDDMVIPDTKWTLVDDTTDQVKDFEQQYMDGLITQGEKYNKVVDAWSQVHRRGRRRDDGGDLGRRRTTPAPRRSRTRST